MAPEHAGEAVEAVVPIMVAGNSEQNATPPVIRKLFQDLIPRSDHAIRQFLGSRHRIGRIPAEHENLASRRKQELARPVRIRKFVRREHEARDGAADRNIVTRIRNKVYVQIAAQRVDQIGSADVSTQQCSDARRQSIWIVRSHPVARIDAVGSDRGGNEMPQMPPEGTRSEPDHSARMFFASRESADDSCGRRARAHDILFDF